MKIEILSIDGMSLAAEAWRLSRDVEKLIEWEDIYTVDSPCNEMPSAFCHFRDFTILEREIFASSRTHVMWARTSFVDAPDKYQVPRDLYPFINHISHLKLKDAMDKGKSAGQHQDEWRRFLPVSAETCFVMRVSYRDAIKYAKYFRYLADGKVYLNLRERFRKIARELTDLVVQFVGSKDKADKACELMAMPKLLYEGDIENVSAIRLLDGVIIAGFSVPLWIRAHFVRHRPISIADDFFQLMKKEDCLDKTIDTPIDMTIAASDDIWKSLLGKRSCWLTQSTLSKELDPWQEIIDDFFDTLGDQILPCADGVCPYHRDARNRLEGTDPGIPCPRYIQINNLDIEPHRSRVEQALKSRGEFWNDLYHATAQKEQTHDHHTQRVPE